MFNLLVSANSTAWETDQLMRMTKDRFKEYSGAEGNSISLAEPETLKSLESVPSLLMYERGACNPSVYERGTRDPNVDIVRLGQITEIGVDRAEITFRFHEGGRLSRKDVEEFSSRLGMDSFEHSRTHWAIKDGGIPRGLLDRVKPPPPQFDVVLSFAGEQRAYVEQVADYLKLQNVKVFYDRDEEAMLWGRDLVEHFDFIYRQSGRYCVMFISKDYAEKMWTIHERRSALARALEEPREYVLPVRFDMTELLGLRPTIHYVPADRKSPAELGKLILKKLGHNVP